MTRRLATVGLLGGLLFALTGCPSQDMLKLEPTKSGERTTTYGKVLDRAEKSACEQYLAQLNQAVHVWRTDHESNPPDLQTVIKASGLPASELQNCKYAYDPASGRVSLAK